MFAWYRDAQICLAYLAEVKPGKVKEVDGIQSRWWTRGWTLQELVAPSVVQFYASDWSLLGDRSELADHISLLTAVPSAILYGQKKLKEISVAQRMSWIARRQTTRIEDMAYSMLGIFDINMPLLYGEGDKAFIRLQEEVMRTSNDQSLFFWTWDPKTVPIGWASILAPAPHVFAHSYAYEEPALAEDSYSMTNIGITLTMEVIPLLRPAWQDYHYLVRFPQTILGIIVRVPEAGGSFGALERCSHAPAPFSIIACEEEFRETPCRFKSSRQSSRQSSVNRDVPLGLSAYGTNKYCHHRLLILDTPAEPLESPSRKGTRRMRWPNTTEGSVLLEHLYSRGETIMFGQIIEFENEYSYSKAILRIFVGIRQMAGRVEEVVYQALPGPTVASIVSAESVRDELDRCPDRVDELMNAEKAQSVLQRDPKHRDKWIANHKLTPSNSFPDLNGSWVTCDLQLAWADIEGKANGPLVLSPFSSISLFNPRYIPISAHSPGPLQ